MTRPGKVTDNAHIESLFHSMKTDIVHGLTFTGDRQIQKVVRAYIPFYDGNRLHSFLEIFSTGRCQCHDDRRRRKSLKILQYSGLGN